MICNFDKCSAVSDICPNGISTFVMLSTESILSISFTSSLQRFGGDIAVGAMTIITSTSQLVLMPLQGICQGGRPIISYNYGAKNYDRVRKAFFVQFKVCVLFTCVSWVVVMAEPVSDILAAVVTTTVFFKIFRKLTGK